MHRYFIQLAYNGTHYHGWQVQPNAPSVQAELNRAVSVITGEEVNLTGAGRTDTGVHASFFIAHFDLDNSLPDTNKFCFKLNSFLSENIRIDCVYRVPEDLHARFSALSRTYKYYISHRKEPFLHNFCSYVAHKPDVERMNEAAQKLLKYTDFTSFSKLHTDVKTNNCQLTQAHWKYNSDGLLVFTISADRFLRNMVRAIVGTLLDVGRGKITLDAFEKIIESKDRGKAGASAKAKGLFLVDIEYPDINFD